MAKYSKFIIHIICLIVFINLTYFSFYNADIQFLGFTSGDELYQFHQIMTMFHGFSEMNVEKVFRYEFYNYGFIFYIYNLILSLPFILQNNDLMTIVMPRIGVAICATFLLIVIYKFARIYLSRFHAIVIILCSLLMPGFWSAARLYKPDMMMALCIALALYFYAKDNLQYSKNYFLGVIFFGISIAVKFQAIYFYPFALLYCIFIEVRSMIFLQFRFLKIKEICKKLAFSFFTPLVIWIVLNPYLLHKRGFGAWLEQFSINMNSNATNHGAYTHISSLDKIKLINDEFFPYIILFILIILMCILFIRFFMQSTKISANKNINTLHDNKLAFFISLSFFIIIAMLYMFLKVNKLWSNYYLSIIVGCIFLLAFLFILMKNKFINILAGIVIIIIFVISHIYKSENMFIAKNVNLQMANELSDEIISILKNNIANFKDLNILSANANFKFKLLGLSPSQIFPIVQFSSQQFDLNEYLTRSNAKNAKFFVKKDIIILPISYLNLANKNIKNNAVILKNDDLSAQNDAQKIKSDKEKLHSINFLLHDKNYIMFAKSKNYIYFKLVK